MNSKIGMAMIWLSGFYVCLNLMSLLPHAGDMHASWEKVVLACALGICGWLWSEDQIKIKIKG